MFCSLVFCETRRNKYNEVTQFQEIIRHGRAGKIVNEPCAKREKNGFFILLVFTVFLFL